MRPIPLYIALPAVALLFLAGCEEPLRFAPTEAQQQAAELTHLLAQRVNVEGTDAASPASEKLVEGTRTNLAYIGRPETPPDPEQFDTVVEQAGEDAIKRPDVWSVADNTLELAIGIAALVGGVYGTKAVGYLKVAKEKSKALQEVVQANDLFKQNASANEIAKWKAAQKTLQSRQTRKVVAEARS